MARKTRRSGEKNDGKDLEMEKFLKELSDNTPHEEQFKRKKMSKSFRQFKKGDYGLREAKASTTHLQYLRAKQAGNNHFEVRRYIADKILNDRKLADAYKSLETIHDTYGRFIGNDAIQLRQRLENMLKQDVKKKSLIGIKFGAHYNE